MHQICRILTIWYSIVKRWYSLRINHANLLKDALQGSGFVRRGSAFFRVWGDGVLQVLKFEYQPGYQVHDLCVGIFSLYGKLYPGWFTSGGCIPRGCIASFAGLRSTDGFLSPTRFTKNDNGHFFMMDFPFRLTQLSDCWMKMESVGNTASPPNSRYVSWKITCFLGWTTW